MLDQRHDYGPIGTKQNWVTERGGLPPMIRDVAHALIRNGHSESNAIQLAVAAVKRWSRGANHVKPSTQAKAAAAVAQWEAMKGSRTDDEFALEFRASKFAAPQLTTPGTQPPPTKSSSSAGKGKTQPVKGKGTAQTGTGKGGKGDHAAGHPFYGNQHSKVDGQGQNQQGGSAQSTAPLSAVQAAKQLGVTPAQAFLLITAWQQTNGQKQTGVVNAKQLAMVKNMQGDTSHSASNPATNPTLQSKAPTGTSSSPGGAVGGKGSGGAGAGGGGASAKGAKGSSGGASKAAAAQKKAATHAAAVAAASNRPATKSSISKAAAINALPDDQRFMYAISKVQPAGFIWKDGKLAQRSDADRLEFRRYLTLAEAKAAAQGHDPEVTDQSWHNSDGPAHGSPSSAQLAWHMDEIHHLPIRVGRLTQAFGIPAAALDKMHQDDHNVNGECGAHEGDGTRANNWAKWDAEHGGANAGKWKLTSISKDEHGTCDHCGKPITRQFSIKGPKGEEACVGKDCAIKSTGWKKPDETFQSQERMKTTASRVEKVKAARPDLNDYQAGELAVTDRLWGDDQAWKAAADKYKRSDLGIPETRDAMSEQGSAALLLPVGPPKKPKARELTSEHHRFKGKDVTACETCGQPLTANVHRSRIAETRHRGPDHEQTPTGHIKGDRGRHVQAARRQYEGDLGQVEPDMESAIKAYFARQRAGTISRLTGKRGKTMLKRAAQPPENPGMGGAPEIGVAAVGAESATVASPGAVDPNAIFDPSFWTQELAQILIPHYNAIGAIASNRVKHQVSAPPDLNDGTSVANVGQILADRAQESAMSITGTTRSEIFSALQEGVANGESMAKLTNRINEVFDQADRVRAHMIAQTETIGAMNQAAFVYADNLPEGIVGSKTWLAHHDQRTRPHHRLADGQTVPLSSKFAVGGFAMDHPGDPTAPPQEVINCRCGTAYLPPKMTLGSVVSAKSLEGLVPATTLAALTAIQAEREKKYPVPA